MSAKKMTHVVAYSDPEGDLDVLLQSRDRGLKLINEAIAQAPNVAHQIMHLSLGDMVDKGADDLSVLKHFKEGAYDNLRLALAGNRDKNKIRFLQELLNTSHLDNLLARNLRPHWLSDDSTRPHNYLLIIIENPKPQHQDFLSELHRLDGGNKEWLSAYAKLNTEWKRVFAALWMLEKTMGCPQKFSLRKENLAKWSALEKEQISDIDVATSFIEEMLSVDEARALREQGVLPERQVLNDDYIGLMRDYLLSCHELIILGKTIFSHGTLSSECLLKDHEGNDFQGQSIEKWVEHYNQEYALLLQQEIERVICPVSHQLKPLDLSEGVALDRFNRSALPTAINNRFTVTTGNHFNCAEPSTKLDKHAADILKSGGIFYKCHGHQPSGFCGTVVEEHGITDVCVDTGISKYTPGSNQSRDGSENTFVVLDVYSDTPHLIIAGIANKTQGGFEFVSNVSDPNSFVGCTLELDGYLFRVSGFDSRCNKHFLLHRDFKNGNSCVAQAEAGAKAPKKITTEQLKQYLLAQQAGLSESQKAKYLPLLKPLDKPKP